MLSAEWSAIVSHSVYPYWSRNCLTYRTSRLITVLFHIPYFPTDHAIVHIPYISREWMLSAEWSAIVSQSIHHYWSRYCFTFHTSLLIKQLFHISYIPNEYATVSHSIHTYWSRNCLTFRISLLITVLFYISYISREWILSAEWSAIVSHSVHPYWSRNCFTFHTSLLITQLIHIPHISTDHAIVSQLTQHLTYDTLHLTRSKVHSWFKHNLTKSFFKHSSQVFLPLPLSLTPLTSKSPNA